MNSQSASPLDILAAPLKGRVLVEASAGTGKTYTITRLFIRLIVEGVATIDQILVVTYTKAATAELRDRIRQGLTAALEAFQTGNSADATLDSLVARSTDREQALLRLGNALMAFDEVAIYTIHGFCQRALADHAFESGRPFESELLTDDLDLLAQIVQDFWRREIYNAPGVFVDYLRHQRCSPESLLGQVRGHVEKPFLKILAPDAVDFSIEAQTFTEAYARAREIWRNEKASISALLIDNQNLNGKKYPQEHRFPAG